MTNVDDALKKLPTKDDVYKHLDEWANSGVFDDRTTACIRSSHFKGLYESDDATLKSLLNEIKYQYDPNIRFTSVCCLLKHHPKFKSEEGGVSVKSPLRLDCSNQPEKTALVVVDPHNDFMTPTGKCWPHVKSSVEENKAVVNIQKVIAKCRQNGYPIIVSPHSKSPLNNSLLKLIYPDKSDPDFGYPDGLFDSNTIFVSPHTTYSPIYTDLQPCLHSLNIRKVILIGMISNLCFDSHLRTLVDWGFDVTTIWDATAGYSTPKVDGYGATTSTIRLIGTSMMSTAMFIDR